MTPFKNAAPYLRSQLAALVSPELDRDWQVIAVDDSPDDESLGHREGFTERSYAMSRARSTVRYRTSLLGLYRRARGAELPLVHRRYRTRRIARRPLLRQATRLWMRLPLQLVRAIESGARAARSPGRAARRRPARKCTTSRGVPLNAERRRTWAPAHSSGCCARAGEARR